MVPKPAFEIVSYTEKNDACGDITSTIGSGNWVCNRPRGHEGPHAGAYYPDVRSMISAEHVWLNEKSVDQEVKKVADEVKKAVSGFIGQTVGKEKKLVDRAYRFLCGLSLQDQPLSVQKEQVELCRLLGAVLNPDKSHLEMPPNGKG